MIGEMTNDKTGTAIAVITGTPPFPSPTQIADSTAVIQKTDPSISAPKLLPRCSTLAPRAAKD